MSLPHPGAIRIGVATDEAGRIASVDLRSSRPAGVGRLFVGRNADDAPRLAASLFGLCGFSHGVAARRAIAAAGGDPVAPTDDAIGLMAERLAETLRATVLDWPGAPSDRTSLAAPLREAMMAARALMSRQASAVNPAPLLERLEAAVAACGLRPDASEADGFFGALMGEARAETLGALQTPDALAPVDDAAVIAALRDGRARFAAAPFLPGRVVETGAFARHWRATTHEKALLAGRLAARFRDLRETMNQLRRLCAGGADSLASAGSSGAGEGFAAVETARGRLYHWVRLDGARRILDYEMLAPTEWNFHPEGPFVLALRGAEIGSGAAATRRVARLAAVFDPCVAFEIEVHEPAHA